MLQIDVHQVYRRVGNKMFLLRWNVVYCSRSAQNCRASPKDPKVPWEFLHCIWSADGFSSSLPFHHHVVQSAAIAEHRGWFWTLFEVHLMVCSRQNLELYIWGWRWYRPCIKSTAGYFQWKVAKSCTTRCHLAWRHCTIWLKLFLFSVVF